MFGSLHTKYTGFIFFAADFSGGSRLDWLMGSSWMEGSWLCPRDESVTGHRQLKVMSY